MKKLLLLVVILLLWSCSDKPSQTTITGNSKTLAGKTVYLKKYSHFDYLEDYMIDSTVVDPEGNFAFSLQVEEPQLLTLATTKRPPGSYMILRDMPEDYHHSFCERFFGADPTLYINAGADYKITDWNPEEDLVTYEDDLHNLLRTYYKNINFRKHLKNELRALFELDAEQAWNKVGAQRDSILVELDLEREFENKSFGNYLRTEVELGALNAFLRWNYSESLNPLEGERLGELMDIYNNGNWNHDSMEFYKLTERYISHQMNKQEGKNLAYYEPSAEKITMAEKYADLRIREKYVRNLRILLERKEAVVLAEMGYLTLLFGIQI